MQPSVDLRFVVEIPFESLGRPALSYDHDLLDGKSGIHPVTRQRGVPAEAMPGPEEHLRRLIESGRIDANGFAFTLTHRNAFQNLRCPLWSASQGLCQSALEQVQQSRRPYYGVAYPEDGTVRLMQLDFRQPVPEGLRSFCGVTPVLWDGSVLPLEEIAPEAFDHRHLWKCRADQFEQLAEVFHRHLHSPAAEAGQALCETAASLGLEREDSFLHHAVACNAQSAFIIVAVARLEDIGRIAAEAGATHCGVVENGGSIQVGLYRPGQGLRVLLESFYFRPPTIALAVYPIRSEETRLVPVAARQGLLRR